MICHNCGSDNRELAKYCARCGAKMKQSIALTETQPQSQHEPVKDFVVGSVLDRAFFTDEKEEDAVVKNAGHIKHTRKHTAAAAKTERDQQCAHENTDKPKKNKKKNQPNIEQQQSNGLAQQAASDEQTKQALPSADTTLSGICVQCGSALSQTAKFCMRCGALQSEKESAHKPHSASVTATSEQKSIDPPEEKKTAATIASANPSASVPQTDGLVTGNDLTTSAESIPAKKPQAAEQTEQKLPEKIMNASKPQAAAMCVVCNEPITDDIPYCNKCGTPASKATVPHKKNKKMLAWTASIAAALVLLVGGTIGFTNYRAAQYRNAIDHMGNRNYDAAYRIFNGLGNYELSKECSNYCEAQVLFEAGQYEQAKTLFTSVQDYSDAAIMAQQCQFYIDYANAADLLAQGKNYEAYIAYNALGDFLDSATLKRQCIMVTPKSGILYQNTKYESTDITLRIKNQSFNDTYLKIYDGDTLVATIFIRSEDVAVITLKSGVYSMNKAMGLQWFGEEGMFGDDGYYGKVLFDQEGTDRYQFVAGSEGTLTIAGDAGFESKDIDRKAC